MQIYFICTGNTCRSPMAEAILKHKKLENVDVYSAGVYAQSGVPMSTNAQIVLQEHGIEAQHQSSPVDINRLNQSDLILTMTESHLHALLQVHPHIADKAFTLHEYVYNLQKDVSDPYGGSVDVYRRTFEELQRLIDALQSKIVED